MVSFRGLAGGHFPADKPEMQKKIWRLQEHKAEANQL